MKIIRLILIAGILSALLPSMNPVAAQSSTCPGAVASWEQARTASFALIYPKDSTGDERLTFFPQHLEAEYARLSLLFQSELILPINLRLYASEADFYCLNTRAARLPKGFLHTRIGNREIALILEDLDTGSAQWQDTALNTLRYELAALFVEQITDSRAAPGLVAGAGGYLQDPRYLIQGRPSYGWTRESSPGWQRLWEDTTAWTDSARLVEATTIVAYLVDVYGWPGFLAFLKAIATSGDDLSALVDNYDADLALLEAGWLDYTVYYLGGRWQFHVLYNYDFSSFEALLQAGAYEDAAAGLKSARAFLESIGNPEKAARAGELLRQAQLGQSAGALVAQSRQSLLDQDYGRTLVLVDQARRQYQALNDTRRDKELAIYQAHAEEALTLRAEVEQIQARFDSDPTFAGTARLLEIGKRQQALGDKAGADEVQALLSALVGRIQQQLNLRYLLALIAVVMLVGLRLFMLLRPPRPEVLL